MLINKPEFTGRYAFLHTGFRPFFALAGLGGALLMLLWFAVFSLGSAGIFLAYPTVNWHSHEMIFGFGAAAVTGFLLTAVRNWTGQQTVTGYPMLALALCWVLARVFSLVPGLHPLWAAGSEVVFLTGFLVAISRPVIQVRQWRQMGILVKVALLIPASILFHLGVAKGWSSATTVGLYAGLYLLLSLVFTLARRVMPMFIERGLLNGFVPRNISWVDHSCLAVFLLFCIADTWLQTGPDNRTLDTVVSILAATLALLHSWRLAGWYHKAIWKKPMIWVLFLAYVWLILGFFLKVQVGVWGITHSLAMHALAAGGMGMMIAGMMARVSLGHTGRNVNEPSRLTPAVFFLVAAAGVLRVLGPLFAPDYYLYWIGTSQLVWSLAFALFSILYIPMLIKPRIDGMRG